MLLNMPIEADSNASKLFGKSLKPRAPKVVVKAAAGSRERLEV
jgi:hypothetical protein